MDPNVSLTLSKRADETLWGKAISSIGRVVYSSNFNIYILLIATKRSSVLRAFDNYVNINSFKDAEKRNSITQKYEKAYSNYINILEKCIVENIYSKVKKGAATFDEQHIMSGYYEICKYKNEDPSLFRNKLEILTLGMDWSTVQTAKSDNYISRYKEFFVYNIEELYKSQMRHHAIAIANAKEGDRDQYEAVYSLIETYIKEVLPILPEKDENNQIIKDYRKYVTAIDAYDRKDFLELRKRLTLLGFSKPLFEYALPMVAKEQCYKEIMEVARVILTNYYTEAEQFAAYEVVLDAIEEYADNILDYKIYWDSEEDKKAYKKFNEKLSLLKKLARIDYDAYKRQREILFIKYDLAYMNKAGIKLPEVRSYYKERLIIRHAIKNIKSKPQLIAGSYKPNRKNTTNNVEEELKIDFDKITANSSPIEKLIENIVSIIDEQIKLANLCKDETKNVADLANTDIEEITNNLKNMINFANGILKHGKKYKKRRAM